MSNFDELMKESNRKVEEFRKHADERVRKLVADQDRRGVVIPLRGGYTLNVGAEVSFEEAFGPPPDKGQFDTPKNS